jgi:hypothetical protein
MSTSRATLVAFLLRGFLRLLVLVTPLFLVFALIDAFGERRVTWLDTTFSAGDGAPPDGLDVPRPGTDLQVEGHVRYVVDNAPGWLWSLWMMPGLMLAVAMSAVALLLLRMMSETYAGRPFSDVGVRRLRRVAAVIALAGVAVPLTQSVAAHAVAARVVPHQAPGWLDNWDLLGTTIPWLVVALLVLAIAEAFDIGTRLADDVEGLV